MAFIQVKCCYIDVANQCTYGATVKYKKEFYKDRIFALFSPQWD